MNSGFNFPQGTSDFTRRTRTPLNNEISLVGDDRNKNDNEFNVEEKNKSKLNEVSIIENTPPIRSTSTPPFQISNMNQMKNDGNLNNTLENYYDLDLNAKMKELSLNV